MDFTDVLKTLVEQNRVLNEKVSALSEKLSEQSKALEEKLSEQSKALNELGETFYKILPEVNAVRRIASCPWLYDLSSASSQRKASFRRGVIKYYSTSPAAGAVDEDEKSKREEQLSQPRQEQVICLATGKSYDASLVRAAHIWKHSTKGKGMALYFGLSRDDVKNPRNGLLLLKVIEEAFDRMELCFLYNPLQRVIVTHILRPSLTKKKVDEELTFADLHGRNLHLPPNVFPFRRILAHHARWAIHKALQHGWIQEEEMTRLDGNLCASEGAIWPRDLALDEEEKSSNFTASGRFDSITNDSE